MEKEIGLLLIPLSISLSSKVEKIAQTQPDRAALLNLMRGLVLGMGIACLIMLLWQVSNFWRMEAFERKDKDVRAAVVRNPKTPEDILRFLAEKEPGGYVGMLASQRLK